VASKLRMMVRRLGKYKLGRLPWKGKDETHSSGVAFAMKVSSIRLLKSGPHQRRTCNEQWVCTHTWFITGRASPRLPAISGAVIRANSYKWLGCWDRWMWRHFFMSTLTLRIYIYPVVVKSCVCEYVRSGGQADQRSHQVSDSAEVFRRIFHSRPTSD